MIGILGGMGTQAGLDFCNKLAVLNRGKIDQEYPLFLLYNKSNIPGRPESIGSQTKNLSNRSTNKKSKIKYERVLKSLLKGCKLLEKNKCKFIVIPCNTAVLHGITINLHLFFSSNLQPLSKLFKTLSYFILLFLFVDLLERFFV